MAPIDRERDRPRPEAGPVTRVAGRLHTVAIRYRAGRWIAAAAAGLLAALAVGGAMADAESARAGWGRPVEVAVARRVLRTGETVTTDSVEMVAVPAYLVPADALDELPTGHRVVADTGPGEILVVRRLTARAGSASSLGLPAGTRGVSLERGEVVGQAGDVVDLHAVVGGVHLAEAVVVHGDDSSVTIAVPVADVAAVVDALSRGGLITVLVP